MFLSVKKSHRKRDKSRPKTLLPSCFLLYSDGFLQDSSAKGPLLYADFKQGLKLSNSILQTRQSVVQIKAAKTSTEFTKGDTKSIVVLGFLNNSFLPLTLL